MAALILAMLSLAISTVAFVRTREAERELDEIVQRLNAMLVASRR